LSRPGTSGGFVVWCFEKIRSVDQSRNPGARHGRHRLLYLADTTANPCRAAIFGNTHPQRCPLCLERLKQTNVTIEAVSPMTCPAARSLASQGPGKPLQYAEPPRKRSICNFFWPHRDQSRQLHLSPEPGNAGVNRSSKGPMQSTNVRKRSRRAIFLSQKYS